MADTSPDAFRRTRILQSDLPAGTILIDQTRERTSWAEGMFVTAAQFNRDQSYVIARQGDLGRAVGAGVIAGLEVTQPADDPTSLLVAPGLGLGGGGESIVLHASVSIALADIALQKSLTQGAGLTGSLGLIGESRTGLFVLCASPVEYTSNPVGSYATTASGQRKLQDSVVTEAVLFTLVPFTLSASSDTATARRSMAARRVFLDGAFPDIPSAALPLAMMELDGNVVQWLDMHLARRMAGAARADAFGLGVVDTPARAAHFAQYDAMITEMVDAAPNLGFAAADRFDALPPMGRMPTATVAQRAPAPGLTPVLSQAWLPAEMPVELTALPEDEIAQLLEESLTMPPIDLQASPAALAQTPVTVIVPIARENWATAPLEVVQQSLTLRAAAPLGATPRTPMELIESLLAQDADPDLVDATDDAAWLPLLAGRPTLWYMRRRQFLRTDALTGEAYAFASEAPVIDEPDGPSEPAEPVPDMELVRKVNDTHTKAVAVALSRLGLADHAAAIVAADTEDGHLARADIDAAVAQVVAQGSDIVLADLVQRAGAAGNLTRDGVAELVKLYEIKSLARSFVPFEGILTGGPVDLRLPDFKPDEAAPRITADFARKANGGPAPRAAEVLAVPDDMATLVRKFLDALDMPDEVVKSILIRGGGEVPLGDGRGADTRMKALKLAAELRMPILAIARAPGSVEAQTRRNLLLRAGMVPKLTESFARNELPALLDPLLEHIKVMDQALGMSIDDAVRAVEQSTTKIAEV